MASRRFVAFLKRSLVCTRSLCTSQIRCCPKKYSQFKEDVVAYNNFRREMRRYRFEFQKDLRAKQEMSMEEFNVQAAEEARLEREVEERALESNKMELERMSQKRAEATERWIKRMEEKFVRGTIAREAWESRRIKQREQEVATIQEVSASFITLENLDEKIQEVIDNEIEYNFALSTTGEIITS